MNDIQPCTVKGCRETIYHHHYTPGIPGAFECDSPNSCVGVSWLTFSPVAAPARLTRKALNARIAALESENAGLIERGWADEKVICDMRAENADLHAEIADKKDRLARCEGGPVRVEVASPAEVAREIEAALAVYRRMPKFTLRSFR